MKLETKKLAEKWEYIQGGLLFIDETEDSPDSCLSIANGELKHYINSLSSVQQEAAELIEELHLTDASKAYTEVPESFLTLLEHDIAYLSEDPAVMDESYGSMAMIAFYRHVSDFLKIPSSLPDMMRDRLEARMREALPNIRISW